MENVVVAESRTEVGKGANGRLRRAGKLPAVMYGHAGAQSIVLDEREFGLAFKNTSESTILKLKIGKKESDVLIKDYQEDVLSGRLLHVDFFEIERGKKLRTHIAIHLEGTPQEVREGAVLENPLHEVEVECLPKDLIDVLNISVEDLTSTHALHVGDIKAPEGIRILTNADAVVAAVVHQRETVAATEEGEAAGAEEVATSEEAE